jgi:Protein of unknown function (DUF938)
LSGVPEDARRFSPSVARNRDAICSALVPQLPKTGLVLEIASGSGEHILRLAAVSPAGVTFQPTDPDPMARASIDAWCIQTHAQNIKSALHLDVMDPVWSVPSAAAIICINMIHIAPWPATQALFAGAAAAVHARGFVYLYGPFRRAGQHTSAGNESFDGDLRSQNAAWGVRDIEDVRAVAAANGFADLTVETMPANNLSLFFRR